MPATDVSNGQKFVAADPEKKTHIVKRLHKEVIPNHEGKFLTHNLYCAHCKRELYWDVQKQHPRGHVPWPKDGKPHLLCPYNLTGKMGRPEQYTPESRRKARLKSLHECRARKQEKKAAKKAYLAKRGRQKKEMSKCFEMSFLK